MTRQTFTKSIVRRFDLGKDLEGKATLIPRDTMRPAEMPKKIELDCGLLKFDILVSEGQYINKRKMCKKLIKKYNDR